MLNVFGLALKHHFIILGLGLEEIQQQQVALMKIVLARYDLKALGLATVCPWLLIH